jgi:hypothetical protein
VIHILNPILSIFWGGFVLSMLWRWFFVPLGIPAIAWWQGAGIALLCVALTGYCSAYAAAAAMKTHGLKSEHNKYAISFFAAIFPTLALASGWVIKTFGPIIDGALQ